MFAGTKSPNLATAEPIIHAAGFDLDLVPRPAFREATVARGRVIYVPAVLDRRVFASMLSALERLTDEDLPVPAQQVNALRAYFDDWAAELTNGWLPARAQRRS